MSLPPIASHRVPYVDLAAQHAPLREEILAAVGHVLDHGKFILGDEVALFEKEFASLCGTRLAVAVNSGTDALVLALRALEIGPGDEVITVPNSFVASTSAIIMAGARPVFVDVRDDFNLDPDKLPLALSSRTKAILPVHLTGKPADMAPILEFADRKGLAVVEDAAQAVWAEYQGRPVGSWGTVGCFSLHPLKTLNACGDGGVLTTNDEKLCERLRTMRNLGLRNRDDCEVWSGNSRLDTLQAAILRVKLKHLPRWTEKRRANAALYRGKLSGVEGVSLPTESPRERAVYHTFVIQADRRDDLKAHLARRGVETAIHYPIPIHLQTAGRKLGHKKGDFPVAESQADRILSLPIHHDLTPDQIDHVGNSLIEFYRN